MEIEKIRKRINELDKELFELLIRRMELAGKVGEYKKEHGLPVEDPEVEIKNWQKKREELISKNLDPDLFQFVYEAVLASSRKVQRKMMNKGGEMDRSRANDVVVGVMGGHGSFSEAAAKKYLTEGNYKNFSITYPVVPEELLKQLDMGKIDKAVFPIFNTIAGLVFDSVFALGKYAVVIEDHFDFEVVQCLMIRPKAKLADIKRVMSHPHALNQCRGFIEKNFPEAELVRASDTAVAAEVLSGHADYSDTAVIGPELSAEIYGLEIVDKGIADLKNNLTHFLVVRSSERIHF